MAIQDKACRGLLERGAIGLITTHDLALAQIADEMAPAVENVHFQDSLPYVSGWSGAAAFR